jgi:methyl-accepting chemotaxis protein
LRLLNDSLRQPDLIKAAATLVEHFNQAEAEFDALLDRQRTLDDRQGAGLHGAMESAGQQFLDLIDKESGEAVTADLRLLAIATDFQTARRLVAAFEGLRRPQIVEDVANQIHTIHGRLERREKSGSPGQSTKMIAVLADFESAFNVWASGILEIQTKLAEYDVRMERMTATLTLLDNLADAELESNALALRSELERGQTRVAAILLLMLAFGAVASLLIARSIARPMEQLRHAMQAMARGQNDVALPLDRSREVGSMAQALRVFRDAMIDRSRLSSDREVAAAAETQRANMVAQRVAAFDAASTASIVEIRDGARNFERTADELTAMASDVTSQAQAATTAARAAASNIEEAARATEEIARAIDEVSGQAGLSTGVAQRAMQESRRTRDSMESLSGSAQKIGDVVNLIRAVANQTNLLALNATIEAARAGEAGRGFAVVASEVKALAAQTARATDEIAQLVAAIQAASDDAAGSIHHMSGTIDELTRISVNVATAVEEQSATVSTIAESVGQAAQLAQNGQQAIAGVSGAAEQARSAALEVTTRARDLWSRTERLESEIGRFLAQVRSA